MAKNNMNVILKNTLQNASRLQCFVNNDPMTVMNKLLR